jgi:hypothetical protein
MNFLFVLGWTEPQLRRRLMRLLSQAATVLCLLFAVSYASSNAIPNPVLYFTGPESVTSNGKKMIRYHFDIDNKDAYPAEMFAPAPKLPPCGANTKASRTWVDIYDQAGKRLNGFCALGKPADLNGIWFALPEDETPPSWVYIEMTDRQTNTRYKSNIAETTQ